MVGCCPDYGAGDSQQNPQDLDHTHAMHMVGWCPDYGAGKSQQNPQDSDHTHAMQDSQ